MELNLEAMLQESGQRFAELGNRCMMLAGQLKSMELKAKALEEENAKLKEGKTGNVVELKDR